MNAYRYLQRAHATWTAGFFLPHLWRTIRADRTGHEGATTNSPLPSAEVRAAGTDPMLTKQVEIHAEVAAKAAEIEAFEVEIAELTLQTQREFDVIFAPMQDGIDSAFARAFDTAEKAANLGSGWCHGWYVDAINRAAQAEAFAREAATGDIYATQEFDMRAFQQQDFALALLAA